MTGPISFSPGMRFLIAATALLCLAGCVNPGTLLLVEGKPISGQVGLSQKQVGYMGSGKVPGSEAGAGLGTGAPA